LTVGILRVCRNVLFTQNRENVAKPVKTVIAGTLTYVYVHLPCLFVFTLTNDL